MDTLYAYVYTYIKREIYSPTTCTGPEVLSIRFIRTFTFIIVRFQQCSTMFYHVKSQGPHHIIRIYSYIIF